MKTGMNRRCHKCWGPYIHADDWGAHVESCAGTRICNCVRCCIEQGREPWYPQTNT